MDLVVLVERDVEVRTAVEDDSTKAHAADSEDRSQATIGRSFDS